MIRNYLKIAWRNIIRNKTFSAINILGLSVGLTCCMLLLLYIRSELAFDKHHQQANNLYLLSLKAAIGQGAGREFATSPAPYAPTLRSEYPEIEETTRLFAPENKTLIQVREPGKQVLSFYETKGYQVDSNFFAMFSYEFVEGSPANALADRNAVVLSEEVAQKLFGTGPALDKTVRISGDLGLGEDFKVTGVYRDASARSHIDARFFVPLYAGDIGNFLRESRLDFANNNMFFTYLRLRPGTEPAQLMHKLPAFVEKYARADLKQYGFDVALQLVPVKDLHLADQFQSVVTPTNTTTYLYILASIAIFTLLIACINFMNLSTARSARRAAEVGVRKVMGAEKFALVWQFLGESMVLTLLALVISLVLVVLLLPVFNQLTGKQLHFTELLEPGILLTFVGLALLTGFIAGSYPAFYLSLFNPVLVLKGRAAYGKFANTLSSVVLRRGLVVFQFVVSVVLVLATFVILEQMKYLRNTSLGFTQDQQIAIPFRSGEARAVYSAFRNEVLTSNQVVAAGGAQYYPGIFNASDLVMHRPDQPQDQGSEIKINRVDYEYLQTMGFDLKQGRLFSREYPGDTNDRMVVNEALLKEFQIPADKAIGQRLSFDWQGVTYPFEIVGVVKDFHYENLHQTIRPYAFLLNNRSRFNYLIVHVNTDNMQQVLGFMEQKWKALRPDEPFEYTFLNEDFQKNYQAEARTSRIVSYFTIISILISCLGLFGLAAFAAQQRTKEIGVRKVLGASVGSIVALLSQDFLKLVLIAILIASPIAWYAMNQWLSNFAYKIDIGWWIFALAGGLAVGVALLTVSFQAIKAALMNPVKSLRSE
ncbi:ABC transporter permease [Rhabdobacter roseus]|uniref:Putative ABC transport system permease protein n=1 Tax=Rhabdobacter roseus TaxID=1655419 RepID=A0A840TPC4_9BACT|nr:ABC transporter permease [Rhabdobacter roseus]MBB5285601.1 putative ABC transport system permease protein [Rhabdobacter roseus]